MVDATEKVLSFRGYPKLEVDGGVFPADVLLEKKTAKRVSLESWQGSSD